MAQVYFLQGKIDKAYETIDEFIEINPDDLYAHLNNLEFSLGIKDRGYNNSLERESIKRSVDKLKILGKNNSEVLEEVSIYYRRIGEFEKSIDYINRCIVLKPNNSQYKYTLSTIYYEIKEFEKSLKILLAYPIDPSETPYGVWSTISLNY